MQDRATCAEADSSVAVSMSPRAVAASVLSHITRCPRITVPSPLHPAVAETLQRGHSLPAAAALPTMSRRDVLQPTGFKLAGAAGLLGLIGLAALRRRSRVANRRG